MSKLETETKNFSDNIKCSRAKFKKICNDPKIPLDQRWKSYLEIGHIIGERESSMYYFKSLPKGFIRYDGDYFNTERYKTITVQEIADYILEYYVDVDDVKKKIDLDKFKEEVLKSFIWSFVYDW